MLEISISLGAILTVLFWGREGAKAGFFVQTVAAGLAFFAMMVALRFWFPASVWLSGLLGGDSKDVAFAAFWALFAGVFAPLYGLLRSLNGRFVPAYPLFIERAFGFIAGCLFGGLLTAGMMTSLLLYLPKIWPGYEASRMLLPLDRAPIALYQKVQKIASERQMIGEEHIVLPELTKAGDDRIVSDWK